MLKMGYYRTSRLSQEVQTEQMLGGGEQGGESGRDLMEHVGYPSFQHQLSYNTIEAIE